MKIKHFCINVKDLEKSIDFYCNTLGLGLANRFSLPENDLEIALVVGEEGNVAIELVYQRGKEEYVMGDYLGHLAFIVGDVDATVEELRNKGIEIVREPFNFSKAGLEERLAFVKDPDGILLEISS
ncbi:MAG: VOC family protein [Candidatus Bathyarchaeota archaeon]|nr:MAG: VOC family protein [Candidatus Bathyarchaeota archaeon]